jgi:hypothetical protein
MKPEEKADVDFAKGSLQEAVIRTVIDSDSYRNLISRVKQSLNLSPPISINGVDDIYRLMKFIAMHNSYLPVSTKLPLMGHLSFHSILVSALAPTLRDRMQFMEAMRSERMTSEERVTFDTSPPFSFSHLDLPGVITLITQVNRSIPIHEMKEKDSSSTVSRKLQPHAIMPVGTTGKNTLEELVATQTDLLRHLVLQSSETKSELATVKDVVSAAQAAYMREAQRILGLSKDTQDLVVANGKQIINAATSPSKIFGSVLPQLNYTGEGGMYKPTDASLAALQHGTPSTRDNRAEVTPHISPQSGIVQTTKRDSTKTPPQSDNSPQDHSDNKIKSACFEFAKTGRCKYGDTCKYLHVPSQQPPTPDRVTRSATRTGKFTLPANKAVLFLDALSAGADTRQSFFEFAELSDDPESVDIEESDGPATEAEGHTVM